MRATQGAVAGVDQPVAGGYDSAGADRRCLIDQLVSRTLRYDELVRVDVAGHGLRLIAAYGRSPRELVTEALNPFYSLMHHPNNCPKNRIDRIQPPIRLKSSYTQQIRTPAVSATHRSLLFLAIPVLLRG